MKCETTMSDEALIQEKKDAMEQLKKEVEELEEKLEVMTEENN